MIKNTLTFYASLFITLFAVIISLMYHQVKRIFLIRVIEKVDRRSGGTSPTSYLSDCSEDVELLEGSGDARLCSIYSFSPDPGFGGGARRPPV
jgi:hypothetical protein